MRELVTVTVATAYPELAPVGETSFDPLVTAVSYDTQAFGWGRGRVGLLPPDAAYAPTSAVGLREPLQIPENAHVEFWYGGALVYEGVAVRVMPNGEGFECEGYGLWATKWSTVDQGGEERVSRGGLVREAVRVTPWLVLGQLDDPGGVHTWSEVQYRKSGQVIEQACAEGDGETPWMFIVDAGRVARFVPRTPASVPDLVLSHDPATMRVGRELDRVDAVRLVYQGEDRVRRVTNWHYRPGVDRASRYLRRETLTGSASAGGALAVVTTQLAERGVHRLSGSVTFTDWQHLDKRYGSTFALDGYGAGIVDQTSVDLFLGTSTLTLGQPSRGTFAGLLRELARTEAALRTKTDPVTGDAWRW